MKAYTCNITLYVAVMDRKLHVHYSTLTKIEFENENIAIEHCQCESRVLAP